jgi:hypothetical protein
LKISIGRYDYLKAQHLLFLFQVTMTIPTSNLLMETTDQGQILTCIPDASGRGMYVLWQDRLNKRWRWALRNWPDDNLGISNHGAADSPDKAIIRCQEHVNKRKALRNLS